MQGSWVSLEQKYKDIEKLEIKEKLTRLNIKIKGLERSFRETLETLTGNEDFDILSRKRSLLIEEKPRFLKSKAYFYSKPKRKEYLMKKDEKKPIVFTNSYLKTRLKDPIKEKTEDFLNKNRDPQEIYKDYLAESKMKLAVRKIKEKVQRNLSENPKNLKKNKENKENKEKTKPKGLKTKKSYCPQCLFLLRKGFPVKYCDCRKKIALKP